MKKFLILLVLLLGGIISSEAQTVVTSTTAGTKVKYKTIEHKKSRRVRGLYLRPELSFLINQNPYEDVAGIGLQGTLLFQTF